MLHSFRTGLTGTSYKGQGKSCTEPLLYSSTPVIRKLCETLLIKRIDESCHSPKVIILQYNIHKKNETNYLRKRGELF